jgi:hypothetical protein
MLDGLAPRVLDMDNTEVRVCGEQEQSAYNGHFRRPVIIR